MPPRTDSYFTARTSGLPYGPGDELHQSTFLMGNLDGAGEKGERAPATNCLHCQLVRVPFFSLCCCCCWRKRAGGFILLGGGYFVFCETFGNPPRWWSLWIGGRQNRNFRAPWEWKQATQQKKSLRWWFAPSAPSIPVSSSEQAAVGWRPDKLPSWFGLLVGRLPVWIPGMFLTGSSAHPL